MNVSALSFPRFHNPRVSTQRKGFTSSLQQGQYPQSVDSVRFSSQKQKIDVQMYPMFINGEFVSSKSSPKRAIQVINPADQSVLGTIADATKGDVDQAVKAAKNAFQTWGKTNPHDRAAVLHNIATQIRANAEKLAQLETLNNGKPINESRADVADSARHFDYYAEQAIRDKGEILHVPEDAHSFVKKEPIGVVGQVIPWNYPLMMAAWKLAPALAAGCTVVIKSAEQTPISLLELAKTFKEAGVPPGVINIITGGPNAGKALVNHPDLDKLSFTGSSEVGRAIALAAASNKRWPIPVTLELGGKSPSIVFADADLDTAVNENFFGIMINQGQVCSAGSRILVHRSVYNAFVDKMVQKAKAIRIGPGLDEKTQMGPLISKEHLQKVQGYVALGKKEGARLVTGGEQPQDPALAKGNYLLPTIFADVNPKSRLAQEEIFGPLAAIIPFDTEEEAIQLANGTDYGLAAAIFTKDLARMHRMANQIQAGIVWGNSSQPAYAEGPWGGVKRSGLGREGIDAYQNKKWIHLRLTPNPDWYGAQPASEEK